jgi:alpha-D-ribose 1-methylphosphonate 5-triphosphate diphosphatase
MNEQPKSFVLADAQVVLAGRVMEKGWVAVTGGTIAEIGDGRPPERGLDLGGDLLIPGLVELHTDHLEAHYMPRPNVYWDPVAAVVSYDGQLATSGITTVLDSLRVAREDRLEDTDGQSTILADAIAAAAGNDLLRADHFLHLRCEVPMPQVVDEALELIGRAEVRLLSLMDHTPGQRQFRDEEKLRAYYKGKGALSEDELDILLATRRRHSIEHGEENYRRLVNLAQAHAKPLASHDDTTIAHVQQAVADGIAIAEFPTTPEAAGALHAAGIRVLMGAPNLMRGGSHSGNVATAELARAGWLDILSSDYVPASLLLATLTLPNEVPSIDLAAAVRTVTKTSAEAVGLHDRGEIATGKRADLVRVHTAAGIPTARSVWRAGRRVA